MPRFELQLVMTASHNCRFVCWLCHHIKQLSSAGDKKYPHIQQELTTVLQLLSCFEVP
jgi:hypothetical protein